MSDVQFDNDVNQSAPKVFHSEQAVTPMSELVMRTGLAKSHRSAQIILLVVAAVAIIAAWYFAGSGSSTGDPGVSKEVINQKLILPPDNRL